MGKRIVLLLLVTLQVMFHSQFVFADKPGIDASTCSNGVQDGLEEGVDCGGPCRGCAPPEGATVYYISSNDGDDANDGLSLSTPWRTLEKLNQSWQNILPGDYVLLKRGDVFAPSGLSGYRGVIGLDTSIIRGSEGSPITIGAYGVGAKPVVSKENSPYLSSSAFHSRYISHVTIQDIAFRGGLYFGAKDSEGEHHVRMFRLTIEGGYTGEKEILFWTPYTEGAAEEWSGNPMYGNELAFSIVKNTSHTAIQFYGQGNNWVHHNEVYDAGGTGINFAEGANNIVEYNIVSGSGANGLKHSAHSFRPVNFILRYNLFMRPGQDCIAIYSQINAEVHNNTFWSQGGEPTARIGYGGLSPVPLCDVGTTGFDNCHFYNNIFCGNTTSDGIISVSIPKGVHITYKDGTEIDYYTNEIWDDNVWENNTVFNTQANHLIKLDYLVPPSKLWSTSDELYANSLVHDTSYIDKNSFDSWLSHENVTNDLGEDPRFVNAYWTDPFNYGDFRVLTGSSSYGRGAYAQETDQPLFVTVVSPAYDQDMIAGEDVSIAAFAGDTDGSVSKVEFFVDDIKVGEDSSAPYSISYSFSGSGLQRITVKATDESDNTATSGAIGVNVVSEDSNNPPFVSITSLIQDLNVAVGMEKVISANADDSDGSIVKVEFYMNGEKIGEDTSSPYSIACQFSEPGACQITAKAFDDGNKTAVSSAVMVNVVEPSVHGDWRCMDIGSTGKSGMADVSGDTITLQGAGVDIWNTYDAFRFFYKAMSGDCEVVVRVETLESIHDWSKAGIMFRESIDYDAKNVLLAVTPKKITLQDRQQTAEETISQTAADIVPPRWLKLARSGDDFSAYYSNDGNEWTFHASKTVSLSDEYLIGLAVTSHVDSVLTTAIFTGLTVQVDPASVAEDLPQEFMVSQNFPNPFNPQTNLRYEIPQPGKVVITIHNALGQQVRNYDMGYQQQGVYDKVFDASDLTSGLYFYTVDTGYSSATGKMLYLK